MSFESRALRLEREHGRAGADDIVVTVAADFLHGGQPTFARTFDRRGSMICAVQRAQGEGWAAFRARAVVEADKVAGACSLLIGGLPDGGADVGGDSCEGNVSPLPTDDLPRGAITLPEAALHGSQIKALELVRQHRRVALVAGRRWGKSTILITLAVDAALSGRRVRDVRADQDIDVAAVDGDRARFEAYSRRFGQYRARRDPAAQWRPCRLLERRS